jgi:hypothetical protein
MALRHAPVRRFTKDQDAGETWFAAEMRDA